MTMHNIVQILKRHKNLILCTYIITIIVVAVNCVYNYLSLQESLKIKSEVNTQISELEYTENNSELMERYVFIVSEYLKLKEEQNDNSIYKVDLNNIEQQIDEINININNINEKIDNLNGIADKSNNDTIISSIITGVCAIIAALIAGATGIIVAKMKVAEKK